MTDKDTYDKTVNDDVYDGLFVSDSDDHNNFKEFWLCMFMSHAFSILSWEIKILWHLQCFVA